MAIRIKTDQDHETIGLAMTQIIAQGFSRFDESMDGREAESATDKARRFRYYLTASQRLHDFARIYRKDGSTLIEGADVRRPPAWSAVRWVATLAVTTVGSVAMWTVVCFYLAALAWIWRLAFSVVGAP